VLYVDNIQYYKTYLQLHSLSQQGYEPESEEQNEALDWELIGLPTI
jgi:hypothetical protein